MRTKLLLFAFAAILVSSCTKVDNHTTGPLVLPQPPFIINGITDMTVINNYGVSASLYLTVQYEDSAQQNVTLSLSGIPSGIMIDTTWQKTGYPTFTTLFTLYDTTSAGAAPGSYPLTLTATMASGEAKTYNFKLKVLPRPTSYLGKYNNCNLFCGGTSNYADSVYADPSVANKIWFTNFANSGYSVYGILSNSGGNLTIPLQTFGATSFIGTGDAYLPHQINISLSSSCAINMN